MYRLILRFPNLEPRRIAHCHGQDSFYDLWNYLSTEGIRNWESQCRDVHRKLMVLVCVM